MNSRELFRAALCGENAPRAPFWIMRQAGRYLPEYRELKSSRSFIEIVKTPELSLEAALQPIRRFDFDCAILFSDILVAAEALGFPYHFRDAGGIGLERTVRTMEDVENMPPAESIRERAAYAARALSMLRGELPQKAVIGFAASPFTLASYMVEGGSSPDFPKFQSMIKNAPDVFRALMERLTEATAEYLSMQAECGADAVQIFDSQAHLAPAGRYGELSGGYVAEVLSRLGGKVPSILFANGMAGRFEEIEQTGAGAYGVDAKSDMANIARSAPSKPCLQGNLDPVELSESEPGEVFAKTRAILDSMSPFGRHILNLGHGIRPDAKIENVEAFVRAAKEAAR